MIHLLEALLGGILAMGVLAVIRRGATREREWLALMLLVAALVYPLCGVGAQPLSQLGVEATGVALFLVFALLGVRASPWFLALGWGAHAVWDIAIPASRDASYLPTWYPMLCLGFDVVVAGYVAGRASGRTPLAKPETEDATT